MNIKPLSNKCKVSKTLKSLSNSKKQINMNWEDEDDDYNPEEERKRINAMPIYQKAEEISKLTKLIIDIIPENDNILSDYKRFMVSDAHTIQAKIAGAEGGDLYSIRMENAAIIRKKAMDIMVATSGLKMFGFDEQNYLNLLREEIEEFRLLFIEWVDSFDATNYVKDKWNFFNPPGIRYEEGEDEIP